MFVLPVIHFLLLLGITDVVSCLVNVLVEGSSLDGDIHGFLWILKLHFLLEISLLAEGLQQSIVTSVKGLLLGGDLVF